MAEPNREFMTRAELRRARQQAEEERRRAEDAERQRRAQEDLAAEGADGFDEFDDLDEPRLDDAEYAPEPGPDGSAAPAAPTGPGPEVEAAPDGTTEADADPEPETAATPIITAVPRTGEGRPQSGAEPSGTERSKTALGGTGPTSTGPASPRPVSTGPASAAPTEDAARPDEFDDVVGPQRNETHPVTPAPQTARLQDPEPEPDHATPAPAAGPAAPPRETAEPTETDDRQTFLRHDEQQGELPAQQGLRGFLNRLGFSLEPTGEELRDRARRARVGRRVDRPRTVSIVNGKGGANKTPTTVLLAAVFGRNSSQSVLAWDNNGTRGTLGWRTAKDAHEGHVMDLLHDGERLLGVSPTELSIDGYVHYQPTDRFSVLRTEPTLLAAEQSVSSQDFDTLHEVVSRYFQLTFVDSGNDESAERWLRMIDHTDQLVIASTTVEEHAEAGALLLAALTKRGGRYAELARNAVVVVSQQSPNINPGQLRRIRRGFEDLARAVVTVPYDPHLVKGKIRYDALKPATQRAWLEAAAAVSDGLVDTDAEPRRQ